MFRWVNKRLPYETRRKSLDKFEKFVKYALPVITSAITSIIVTLLVTK